MFKLTLQLLVSYTLEVLGDQYKLRQYIAGSSLTKKPPLQK